LLDIYIKYLLLFIISNNLFLTETLNRMKRISLFFTFLGIFLTGTVLAQSSPAMTAAGKLGASSVSISYGSPSVKGRTIWGDLVPYGKVWRTGANNATTIEFDKDVTIEGKKLAAGKYALFTIPNQGKWTIIFNTESSQWGAFKYKESADALRVEVTPTAHDFTESMTIKVDEKAGQVILMWEKLMVGFKVS
jgi:Protein of unknown function (DUF2911)